jgi:hypothetical protein
LLNNSYTSPLLSKPHLGQWGDEGMGEMGETRETRGTRETRETREMREMREMRERNYPCERGNAQLPIPNAP